MDVDEKRFVPSIDRICQIKRQNKLAKRATQGLDGAEEREVNCTRGGSKRVKGQRKDEAQQNSVDPSDKGAV